MNERTEHATLFVGTYTEQSESQGIYTLAYRPEESCLEIVDTCEGAPNPSYVMVDQDYLYAAHEVATEGHIASYSIAKDGHLKEIDSYRTDGDAETCSLTTHPRARCIYGANYKSGSISSCQLGPEGRFGEGFPSQFHIGSSVNEERQEGPHVHSTSFVCDTDLLLACDLGIDTLALYATDASGALTKPVLETIDTKPGSGPRMVTYHPHIPLAAAINELSNDVVIYRVEDAGRKWTPIARHDLIHDEENPIAGDSPDEVEDNLAAHIAFSPDGNYLYATVRGSNTLVTFTLSMSGDVVSRQAQPVEGAGPRHFSLNTEGTHLAVANQDSDNVVIFELDRKTGLPHSIAHLTIPQPSCVIWHEVQ